MSCILYRFEDGKAIEERVKAIEVAYLLEHGYSASPKLPVKRKATAKKPVNKDTGG